MVLIKDRYTWCCWFNFHRRTMMFPYKSLHGAKGGFKWCTIVPHCIYLALGVLLMWFDTAIQQGNVSVAPISHCPVEVMVKTGPIEVHRLWWFLRHKHETLMRLTRILFWECGLGDGYRKEAGIELLGNDSLSQKLDVQWRHKKWFNGCRSMRGSRWGCLLIALGMLLT